MQTCAAPKDDGSPCSNPVCPEDERGIGEAMCAEHFVGVLVERLAKAKTRAEKTRVAVWAVRYEANIGNPELVTLINALADSKIITEGSPMPALLAVLKRAAAEEVST